MKQTGKKPNIIAKALSVAASTISRKLSLPCSHLQPSLLGIASQLPKAEKAQEVEGV